MHIKQISIQGFKSYTELKALDQPFSCNHNVIVGRNGSGKSNFFWAIRFVLNDAYNSLSKEERQSLFHDGSTENTAFVEIVFDNSDNRFPTNREETVIRRTLTLKKDEFMIDRKPATKNEVTSLLESAGFSLSNPYFIVPQGRVTALTAYRDSDRLDLLKQVSGTTVYETRRAESTRMMSEAEAKRTAINVALADIGDRLESLEEERSTLAAYLALDRDKRCLDFTLADRELAQTAAELEGLEVSRTESVNAASVLASKLQHAQTQANEKSFVVRSLELKLANEINVELASRQAEVEEIAGNCAVAEASLSTSSQGPKQDLTSALLSIRNEISSADARIAELCPRLKEIRDKEAKLTSSLEKTETQRRLICASLGDSAGSSEADVLARKNDLCNIIKQHQATKSDLALQEANADAAVIQAQSELAKARENASMIESQTILAQSTYKDLRIKRDGLAEQRKELWRKEAKLDSTLGTAEEAVLQLERAVYAAVDKSTARGLQTARTLVEREKIDGVHGTVFDLMSVPEAFRSAVEVVAGGSLFHLVVEDDNVAARVLDAMKSYRQELEIQSKTLKKVFTSVGKISLLPLNRIKPSKQVVFPQGDSAVLRMVDNITFDQKFKHVFDQIFGKAAICKDLSVASRISRDFGLTAVTLQGDRVDKRGALSGGYLGSRNYKGTVLATVGGTGSRLDCIIAYKKAMMECETIKTLRIQVKTSIKELDTQITAVLSEMQKISQEISGRKSTSESNDASDPWRKARSQLDRALEYQKSLKTRIEQVEKQIKEAELQLQIQSGQIEDPFDLSELFAATSLNHSNRLEMLEEAISRINIEIKTVTKEKHSIEAEISKIESELDRNLIPREIELSKQALDAIRANGKLGESTVNIDLDALKAKKQVLLQQVAELEEEKEKTREEIMKAKADLDVLTNQVQQHEKALESQEFQSSKTLQYRNLIRERKEAAEARIRDLGVLPQDFMKYSQAETSTITRKLRVIGEELRKYEGKVNKKASEQYINFTKDKAKLEERKAELDSSAASISQLLQHTDEQKEKALERTYTRVAASFAEVWSQLVPGGQGSLRLNRQDSEDKKRGKKAQTTSEYTGVSLFVSFSSSGPVASERTDSKNNVHLQMSQLSGGQKSLVALALIFAIQKCDPAPFYIFDEIDANLDAQYRSNVASLLFELSRNAQFITTTFRQELLANADQYYGVSFVGRSSIIQSINKEDALQFIDSSVEEKIN